jgi:penicillin-binding protein 2
MMYRDLDERRGPITPQLAIRVAIIGGVALVMFGIIFFRLWYLQVLSGDQYLAEANNNRVRNITVEAPRGEIVDRNGRVLVDNRSGYAVEVNPAKLPTDQREKSLLYERLGKVLRMDPREIRASVNEQLLAVPFSNAIVKPDVSLPVYSYVLENLDRFPGVAVEQVFLREYPHKEVGAHLFGTVGEVTEDQLKQKRYRRVEQGTRVGQSGIEYSYDRFLRGINGADRVQVDASGAIRGELTTREPKAGKRLRLAIDYDVQRTGQNSLAGHRGAFVVMDIKTGEVRALGSQPSFDPNLFAKVIKQSDYDRLSAEENGAPLLNRAIGSAYVTGSTFKIVTAAAALDGGLITPDTVLNDPGSFTVGGVTFKNAGGVVNGAVALRKALQVSSDVFFYQLGADLNTKGDDLGLQHWAEKFGMGRKTGIDLPAEGPGLIPTPKWRNREFAKHQKDPNSSLIDRPWSTGDNVNLSVGQGDLGVSPLQLAVAYAALGNGGYVVKPHLGMRVEDSAGRALQEFGSPGRRKLGLRAEHREAIMEGLHLAARAPSGTSYPVFKDFPIEIAGKTGTAEKGGGRADQSWYAALAPYPNPRYVVVATAEAGGFGADTAAPAVKQILGTLFNVKARNTGPPDLSGVNAHG